MPRRLILLLALALAGACTQPATYTDEITAWRAEKDTAFKGEGSPLPEAKRASFTHLNYFDIDPRYRVPAALTESPDSSQIIEMDTTAGNRDRFRVIGRLEFTLNGEKRALTAYVQEKATDARRLFVPLRTARGKIAVLKNVVLGPTRGIEIHVAVGVACRARRLGVGVRACQGVLAGGRRTRQPVGGEYLQLVGRV